MTAPTGNKEDALRGLRQQLEDLIGQRTSLAQRYSRLGRQVAEQNDLAEVKRTTAEMASVAAELRTVLDLEASLRQSLTLLAQEDPIPA